MKKVEKFIILLFIVVFIGSTARAIFITLKDVKNSEAKISQLKEHLNRLREENTKLKEEIHRLKYDNDYVEILIREELGWTKPGEILCIPMQNR